MATKKRHAGRSGINAQAGFMFREAYRGQLAKFDAAAKKAGMTRTEWLRMLAERELEKK